MFELVEPTHLLFVFVVALLLFGPKRPIEVSHSLGHALQALQRAKEELKDDLTNVSTEDEPVKGRPHPERIGAHV
jgi:TatA/E family protein of Tat protein translocase